MYCIAVDFMRLLRDGELCLPAHNVPFCSFIGLALHWPLVNSQSLEMILFPKSHLASSPTGTQVTEDKLVSVCVGWGRPKWCVCVCVCVCKRASPLEQSSGGFEASPSHIHGPRTSWMKGESSSQLGCRHARLCRSWKKGYVSG